MSTINMSTINTSTTESNNIPAQDISTVTVNVTEQKPKKRTTPKKPTPTKADATKSNETIQEPIVEPKPKKKSTAKQQSTSTTVDTKVEKKPRKKQDKKNDQEASTSVQEPQPISSTICESNDFIESLVTSFMNKSEKDVIGNSSPEQTLSHPPRLLYSFIYDLYTNKIINEDTYINTLAYIHRPEFMSSTKETSFAVSKSKEQPSAKSTLAAKTNEEDKEKEKEKEEDEEEEIMTVEFIHDGKLYLKDINGNLYERLPPHKFIKNLYDVDFN